MFDLFCSHPKALRKVMYAKLASRPRTMVHGDLRLENLFSSKEDPLKFKIIDW
jgi:aminoglycoside phosphotransferase (APT) family kinase protein